MDQTTDLLRSVGSIAARRGVFPSDAYLFVLDALEKSLVDLPEVRDVSGDDLLAAIRALGRERFGVMAGDVFNAWGVRSTLDFGRVVFHLVEEGLLKKRDDECLADFVDRFDFKDAFALKVMKAEG